ncbi:uncharacterized protein LOC121727989 [Aricia agestis]|uniref:uncharacterized protein LOC121727989 n=1 Tax=Aricia agestis TaxID=91739 RepID=UPI001C207288|nr:uncharacterized protein LOC121727989 [Aricia agestis]
MYRLITIALLCSVAAQETTTVTYIKLPPIDTTISDLPLNIPLDNPEITTEVELTTEAQPTTTRRFTRIPFRPNPRFMSKLSYYNEVPTNNFIEKFSKRTYKSKCRCAKIWNCPKLQITVPRCPNEYFMCCF